ncbi:SDR family oxidoreductase [Acetobacteraceae bacterium ESL0709]|nr:SDR family oxidoreductase [Acetobacteraceae bacterium ESL0697]MDF7677282.1 SDR family oxidoreductase [Acetobacteraceae bacterium ESL0709]
MNSLPSVIPRVALVTGGALRLGRAMVQALAAQGFSVAIHCNRNHEAASELLASIGGKGCVVRADLAKEETLLPLMWEVQDMLGPVGVLINNASVFERDEFDNVTRESWERHMQPNLRAPFVLSQAMVKALPDGAEGFILHMLDQRVWNLTPHFVSYTISRSALWSLTRTMAMAFAPRVRVNAIGPGPVLPAEGQSLEHFDQMCRETPLQHGSSPEEIARAALMLLSLPSVTGQMLALDGGQHLNWGPTNMTQDYVLEGP